MGVPPFPRVKTGAGAVPIADGPALRQLSAGDGPAEEQVRRRLSAAREAAAEELQNKGSLYRTCGIALGILVILVLI